MCKAYNCSAPAPPGKHCIRHEEKDEKKKKVYTINKVSKKQAVINRELAKLSKASKDKNAFCLIRKSPNCSGINECLHHQRGRDKENVLNQSELKDCCYACNIWVEENPKEAELLGFKKKRNIRAKKFEHLNKE